MKYQLIENYFQTELFQRVVQDYFDTVLRQMIADNTTLPAKGLYIVDGDVKKDYYDMPYHIHILNGLIPTLFVYEKHLIKRGWVELPETELYLRIFILGFTFHDANKLLGTQQTKDRSDLEIAVAKLDKHVNKWDVYEFLPDFEIHKSTVYFLALGTEDGTAVASGDYNISVNNRKHIYEIQRELCHLADGLASIQNESLESIETLHQAIKKSLHKINNIVELPISYLKVRQNQYTLLSQNLLQVARKTLHKRDKKVLYAMREGFIYWGEDISDAEFNAIESAYLKGSEDDIKFLELTKIDAQKCKFGFLGSSPFTSNILEEITTNLCDRFLALSPNGRKTILGFDGFIELTKKLIETYEIPIDYEIKNDKLVLRYFKEADEEEEMFKIVYNLHKIQWLNTKTNTSWRSDLEDWVNSDADLPKAIELENRDEVIKLDKISDLLYFISQRVKSSDALYKTYLNFIKTYQLIEEADDIEEYIADLKDKIIAAFLPEKSGNNVKQVLFDRYFECLGNSNLKFLEKYNPSIPLKKQMCAFTGGLGRTEYKSEIAFAMKARGFSNRTITSLNNNISYISELYLEENKLRISGFNDSEANLTAFYDFFEVNLSISKEIIRATQKAKNKQWLKDTKIEFEKNVAFEYDLGFEFTKIKTSKKVTFVEGVFWFVRDHLLMLQELGVRSYITNNGASYQPHKAAFHYEGAPLFLKKLGWDRVRLGKEIEVLDEMSLIWDFGKKRLTNTLLKVSQGRTAYFRLYYTMNFKEKDKKRVENSLNEFIQKHKNKFDMTITEELVEYAIQINLAGESSASETWLIRTATDYLRRYVKQDKSREDIIQKICGEINRKLRMENPNSEAIEIFATAVYDRLFIEDWDGKIPTINNEKDWIYQFAFLYSRKSKLEKRNRKAKSLKRQLEEAKEEVNEENIKKLLSKEAKKYANQYLQIIKNLK